jgi:hypothetical protein
MVPDIGTSRVGDGPTMVVEAQGRRFNKVALPQKSRKRQNRKRGSQKAQQTGYLRPSKSYHILRPTISTGRV